LERLTKFAQRVGKFGANFVVFDADGEVVLRCDVPRFESDTDELRVIAQKTIEQIRQGRGSCQGQCPGLDEVCRYGEQSHILAIGLESSKKVVAVALIDMGGVNETDNEELRRFCSQHNVDYELLVNMVAGIARHHSDYLAEMLVGFSENFRAAARAEEQIEIISTELAQTYEELVLLYKMGTNMKVTESDSNYLQMACDNITELVDVESIAILVEKAVDYEKRLILAAGAGLIDIDERFADILYGRLREEIATGKEALLDSEVDSQFQYNWPEHVKSIIAVPLYGSDKIIGTMVAINRLDKPDFDSTVVKLFNSVANECAVFIENGRLFNDLKELFIGSLKALANSIDAKDRYTRGHSERVALICRWIAERLAEEMPVDEEQIHKVYLAGLLHDIGKIGIGESVLCKDGVLTEQEREQMKAHPLIGANILSEIKLMRDIVPGVLCHHERIDGSGYPNGLNGDDIPLTGKIVMLADCFDAMTSKRSYRNAMSIEGALSQIEKGLGTQFDEKLGRIFINSDVYQLWEFLQDGLIEKTYQEGFSEYETKAVGALIR